MTYRIDIGSLNRRIRFERLTDAQNPEYGGSTQQWVAVTTVWAQVQDVLPSKSEAVTHGIHIATRPARIRMRWCPEITSDMRIVVLGARPRTLQIVAGPAELGNRDASELMAEEFLV